MTLSTRAGTAAVTLQSMGRMGIDTTAAAGLTGDALERWIDAALDDDFEKEFAEFSAERAAAAAELAKRKAGNAG